MLLKEKNNLLSKLNYKTIFLKSCDSNFIILNDLTAKINFKIIKIFLAIKKYKYKPKILNIGVLAKKIVKYFAKENIDFDTIVTMGTGGKQLFKKVKKFTLFKDKSVIYLEWHREWENDKSLGFATNINDFDWENKKVIIMEDVIASGNSLLHLENQLRQRNAKVVAIIGAIIQETSPLIKNSIAPTYISVKINKPNDEKLDPFWYPPIYSLRHLLYGDKEMPKFYELLNEKYFNNDKDIENLIKKYRKE